MKRKKIILMGMSASGKDTLRKMLIDKGLKPAVSYTTRPIRENEQNGRDYHFISPDEYNKLESDNFFIESESFKVANGDVWKYGKSRDTIENADILIATPSGVSKLLENFDRKMFYIVEVQCRPEVRFERSIKRGDDRKEANRRMKADAADFNVWRNFEVDEIVKSETYTPFDVFVENWSRVPELY